LLNSTLQVVSCGVSAQPFFEALRGKFSATEKVNSNFLSVAKIEQMGAAGGGEKFLRLEQRRVSRGVLIFRVFCGFFC
jgi:hypothetical protein